MYPVSPLYSQILHPKAWTFSRRRRLGTMLNLAGKLLVVTGILLLLAFAFQLPYLCHLIRGAVRVQGSVISAVLWRLGLIAGGVLLIKAGRQMQR